MTRFNGRLLATVGALLIVFGLACLNFTKPSNLERHREFARTHNLPEPGEAILFGGGAAIASGAGIIGYAVGAGRRLTNTGPG